MLPKPEACRGCPLYGDGVGFVPDELVAGSEIFIVGQNPGDDEEREGRPFVGKTGEKMEREFFPLAGIQRGEVSIGNVLRCRDNHHDDLPTGETLSSAVAHCTTAHFRIPASTRILIAQGHLAWDTLTKGNAGKITDWRGFTILSQDAALNCGLPIYGVLHLSDRNKDPVATFAARRDWSKIGQVMAGTWPSPVPPRLILSSDDQWSEAEQWFQDVCTAESPIAIDTEYLPNGKMTVLGVGTLRCPASHTEHGIPTGLQVMWLTSPVSPWVRAKLCHELQRAIHEVPTVFHNAVADIPILASNMGVAPDSYLQVHDTMLAHAALWSELPHDLEFLASIYGQYPKLKHLASTDILLYNWGDILATIDVWRALEKELSNDPGSKGVYLDQLIPLIPTILESQARGLRVNVKRCRSAETEYRRILHDCVDYANAYAGWPTNLGSSTQLCDYLYCERGYPKDRGRTSADDPTIATLRQTVGPSFDPEDEERRGGLTLEEAITRIEEGGDPILELRSVYAGALQSLSHYIAPCLSGEDGRIYPRFATHTQKDGRWSTTDPPLAQLPDGLRDIVVPDRGECWIGWDWRAIEPRLKQAYTGSDYLRQVFEREWDLHTLNFCAAFGYPITPCLIDRPGHSLHACPDNTEWRKLVKWEGKEDVRRVFCKRLQYKMDYGGSPETAILIPGAKQLGLSATRLRAVGYTMLQADPQALAWRQRIISEAQRTRRVTTFTGRVRRLLGTDMRSIAREAINFPMQAGVSDIFNLTVVAVKRQCPWVRFAWQMHDSVYWACPADRAAETTERLRRIAERPFRIGSRDVCFPADFKPTIYGDKGYNL